MTISDLTYSANPSDELVSAWIAQLGINDALVRREGVKTSLQFFANHMPTLPPSLATGFMRCMDLSKSVLITRLRPGDILVAYRALREDPVRLFYTRKGHSPRNIGLNLAGKVKRVFRVQASMPALQSTTSAAVDTWSAIEPGQDVVIDPSSGQLETARFGVVAAGGAMQLMVPYAGMNLKCLNP